MKFCSRPFKYLYLDNYKGEVALCPWMKKEVVHIGNLFEQPFNAIWNGEKARSLRERIRRGDYSVCRPEGCPFLQNKNLPEKPVEYVNSYAVADTPAIVNLAYDYMCNQYCETCRMKKWQPILL